MNSKEKRVVESKETHVAAVAAAIQRYLDAHPKAADSAEGITRWWLTRQRYEEAREMVEQALERLVTEEKVVKTATAEGTVLYSRTPSEE